MAWASETRRPSRAGGMGEPLQALGAVIAPERIAACGLWLRPTLKETDDRFFPPRDIQPTSWVVITMVTTGRTGIPQILRLPDVAVGQK